jgi:hypothetical protein
MDCNIDRSAHRGDRANQCRESDILISHLYNIARSNSCSLPRDTGAKITIGQIQVPIITFIGI